MGRFTLPKLNLPGGQKLTIGLDIGSHSIKACQMVPEQWTSAFVLHHPEPVYFTIRGQSVLAG